MQYYEPFLTWIEHQKDQMIALTEAWANINSGSKNLEGLRNQLEACQKAFSFLGGEMKVMKLAPDTHFNEQGRVLKQELGHALHIVKRPNAPHQIFFGGHLDTVFGVNSAFQNTQRKNEEILMGPGVCDMKGGLVILLYALQAFEKTPFASQIGWEILITPDEEIGSPGSKALLEEIAKKHHFGILFEPSFPDGALVSERAGSQNLWIIIHGKEAHAGRNFHEGKSALIAICPLISELHKLNSDQVTVNVGELHSGTGFNTVAGHAVCKVNIRADTHQTMQETKNTILDLAKKYSQENITVEVHEGSSRYPKVSDEKTENLFQWISRSGIDLGQHIEKRASRGVSDGNILSNFGLANIDTMGVVGGKLHTSEEYILVKSLVDRAKLLALFLMKFANQEFALEEKEKEKPSVINL